MKIDWVGQCGTVPETKKKHLYIGGWKTTFLLRRPIFRGYVSFRDGNHVERNEVVAICCH